METNQKILKEIKRLKLSFYLTIFILIAGFVVFTTFHFKECCTEPENAKLALTEVSQDYNLTNDSVNLLKLRIYDNRKIEDSLQNRIVAALDSLEILEGKLRVMHQNSGMAKDVLVGVLDSIDFFRTETELLKIEITRINNANLSLLQRERLKNSTLQNRIKQFEKRLKAIYGINVKVSTYFNGHNLDSKLISANKARKVNEIKIDFELTRDIEEGDIISVELMKGITKKARLPNIKIDDRSPTSFFRIRDKTLKLLKPGKYKIVIYHDNRKYGIKHESIGESYFKLD